MVLIDRKIPDFACDVVGLDNAQAATTATEHLVEKGFEAILFLQRTAGLGEYPPRASERFSRYLLTRHHGVVAEKRRSAAQRRRDDGQRPAPVPRPPPRDAQSGHLRQRRPDAAGGPRSEARRPDLGERYRPCWASDELEWAELAGVGITTLKQPTWQIGYAAVEQVIRRIAGTNDPIRERVFSGELIVRGSTSR